MGSANAFIRETFQPESNGFKHGEHVARHPKRIRLSEDAFAVIQTRCAHEATSLEVDHMVLDYTAYNTIIACLASRNLEQQSRSSKSLSASLSMSNAFLPIFKARHSSYKADPELKFRIKLLKLVTLFTQRLTYNPTTPSEPSLESLRGSNLHRAWNWIGDPSNAPSSSFSGQGLDDQLPIPAEGLERNRGLVLQELNIPAEDEENENPFYGTSSCVSLLDILPLFIEVSAARNAMNASNLSERWMDLASEFMLQACLEQYLVVGARGTDVIDEAFAWGYESDPQADVQHSIDINDMFEDEEYATEVDGWSHIKRFYLEQLCLPKESLTANGSSENGDIAGRIVAHLEIVAAKFPIATFEASILAFLDALSKTTPKPLLVQLESGKMDGMNEQETQDFLTDCGVNMARSFQA